MIIGYSNGFHDAGMAVVDNGNILYAGHAERYSRVKNDKNHSILMPRYDGKTVFYEKPFLKNTRRKFAGQRWKSRPKYDKYVSHHWSHAAASYYTKPFTNEPVCVIVDAIGEWDTISIWYKKKKVWSRKYPYSLGLFYSAVTKACGLKPMEDEYITMGMAAYGEPVHALDYLLETNLHKGVRLDGRPEDLAASAQDTLERKLIEVMQIARKYSSYLCYGGGVALNCVANSKIQNLFDDVWIMPNPGDCGSALGAAAAVYGKPLNWIDPYLGYDIKRDINPISVARFLSQSSICGVANGKAEYGPRALGNRSLLADPRKNIKDTVNKIKKRQLFRPFAPAILEEFADSYFDGPMNEYMQYTSQAKHDYKSVTHVDGSARVQIVKKNCRSILRPILEEFYNQTKCPMLLNTSLNIKGQPMVNTMEHAKEFQNKYKVKVF